MGSTMPCLSSLLREGWEGKERRQKCCPGVRDSRSSGLFRYKRGKEADETTCCQR